MQVLLQSFPIPLLSYKSEDKTCVEAVTSPKCSTSVFAAIMLATFRSNNFFG